MIHLRASAGEFINIDKRNPLQPVISVTLSPEIANGITDSLEFKAGKILSVHILVGNKASEIPVTGKYALQENKLSYTPLYRLGYDRDFEVRYIAEGKTYTETFKTPGNPQSAKTAAAITAYPLTDSIPFNTLFFHVRFSEPMRDDKKAYEYVKVYDDKGNERSNPWRQKSFWLDSNRLLVLMVHPGRVKKGIDYMGPLFDSGQYYTLTIDKNIGDIHGNPIAGNYSKKYYITGEDRRSPKPQLVSSNLPQAYTAEPLLLSFNEGVDYASVWDNTTLYDASGRKISCTVDAHGNDNTYLITPREQWQKGKYTLILGGAVYDFASNRINRLFEIKDVREVEKDRLDTELNFEIK